ncbi:ArnT family glycosyltransferase [Micromonospora sp. NPDC048930]|uniref:ArnT family glycosyltransferase n=1 Tax=Micromonospora sp. NPDC048930 TaxID=3364261 RepID=UPI00370FD012
MIAGMTAGVRQESREVHRPRTPRRPRLPVLLALLVGVAAVGYRLALLLADAPPSNSDEATMGLAALHIARGEDFPVWFYGQAYMGTLEAYLAAPLVALTGPSVLALRLPTLALYVLFLALSWRLTRRLGGDPWFGLLVVGFLALGSDRVIKNQLIAGGGYPELNPAGVALALLTVALCTDRTRARLPRWAAWGWVSGLMLWVDPLILPYVLATGVVLVAWRRRELAGRAGLVVAGTLLLGATPMLLDSLRQGRNPLAAVLGASAGEAAASWAERLYGGLVLGPPLGMGFCSPGHCAGWQLWWAAGFPILLVFGLVAAGRTLRATPPLTAAPTLAPVAPADLGHFPSATNGNCPRSAGDVAGGDERRVSAAVRLALLAGAAAVLAAYTVSNAAGRTPVESARYLSCLAVATPALLWPLWRAARRSPRRVDDLAVSRAAAHRHLADLDATDVRPTEGGRRARWAGLAAVAVLAGMLGTAGVATAAAIRHVPAVHAEADRHRALVDALGALGVRHVRGGYWTCNRLTFATNENVVCAVVDDELRPGFDRLPAYRRAVAGDPRAAWVAPVGSPLAARLDRKLGPGPGALDLVTVAGWRVYLPRP